MEEKIQELYNIVSQKEKRARYMFNKEWARHYPNKQAMGFYDGQMKAFEEIKTLVEKMGLLIKKDKEDKEEDDV